MTDLETIRQRIRKLRELTASRGCTEAEALAAAAKAAKLMSEHGISLGDLEFDQDEIETRRGTGAVRARLWGVIAGCTNCAVLLKADTIIYVGREPFPQIATYLHVLTDRAIDRELSIFRKNTWYKRRRTLRAKRAATSDFTSGMVRRLAVRLGELFGDKVSDAALIQAQAERDRRFGNSRAVSIAKNAGRYGEAFHHGHQAGGQVPLSHGVASRQPVAALGGGR